ncbi:MAG: META domain-containing protein [bacterium]
MITSLNRFIRLAAFTLIGVMLMASSGCASMQTGKSSEPLQGSQWVLRAINQQAFPASYAPTANFDESSGVSGSTGCNRYRAHYAQDGETFEVSDIATTKKLCSREKMEMEKRFTALLKEVVQVKNFCGELTLTTGEGDKLVFDKKLTDI